MKDSLSRNKEISLICSEYGEEYVRYEICYELFLERGLPVHIDYTRIIRTKFQDGDDIIEEIGAEDLPYFMRKNLEHEELESWA